MWHLSETIQQPVKLGISLEYRILCATDSLLHCFNRVSISISDQRATQQTS